MAAAVAREVLRQTLRTSSKFVTSECGRVTDHGRRGVFFCASLECPQNVLCNRWKHPTRQRDMNILRTCIAKHHGRECITHQECWKCGTTIDPNKEQYFCGCGVVQPPIEKRSLFQVMGIEEKFDVDVKKLTEKYRDLQRILHPDKYSQKSDTEKEFSIQHSSLVNKAYNTILKPLTRGLYLLRITEDDLEKETQMDLEFLDQIMEANEEIIEAETLEDIQPLDTKNQEVMGRLVKEISAAFQSDNKELAKKLLVQLKYYTNIDDKIKVVKIRHVE